MYIVNLSFNKNTVIAKVEGGSKYLIDKSIAEKYSLNENEDLSPKVLEENKIFAVKFGKEKVLSYLAVAVRTEGEVSRYLKSKNIQPDAVEEIIGFLSDNKLINDSNYSQIFATLRSEDGQSKRRIISKLKQKGVDDELISNALMGISEEVESENAQKLLKRYNESNKDIPPFLRKSKLINKGLSMGFASDLVYAITENLLSEVDDSEYDEYYIRLIDKKILSLLNKQNDYNAVKKKIYAEFAAKGARLSLIDERFAIFVSDRDIN